MKDKPFLKKLREGQGISQRDLSEKSGISRGRLRRLEQNGLEGASYDELRRVAQVLHKEASELLQLLDQPSNIPLLARSGHSAYQVNVTRLGYKIVSYFPPRPDFFAGKLFVDAHKKVPRAQTPKAPTIFLQMFLGGLNLEITGEKYELHEGDCFTFQGTVDYTIENPHLRDAVALILSIPSFRLG